MSWLLLLCGSTSAHVGDDMDEDGWSDSADCAPKDPTAFPGARERCDGIDNDCDDKIDEDGACFDELMPCYQERTTNSPVPDGDPCLQELDADGGCGGGELAMLLLWLPALRRR